MMFHKILDQNLENGHFFTRTTLEGWFSKRKHETFFIFKYIVREVMFIFSINVTKELNR